mmetsp:Transcript_23656/g.55769  ORF Transcript_23656/g.55769 Transcript_23656/m.55769 type:complete len:235 (-) Transcript_23656:91-795(-)
MEKKDEEQPKPAEEDPSAAEEKKDEEQAKSKEGGYPSASSSEAPKGLLWSFKAHDLYAPMETAEDVLYCAVCGLPPDFCQFHPNWDKCKPWCLENAPQYYPELSGISLEDAKKKAEELTEKSKEKLLPGGKVKRAKSPSVSIKKLNRGGRKCVTSVAGLDMFGIKLDDVAKLFKKKFACGCAVVKGENTLPDTVDIQGDFEDEVIDIIVAEWKQVPQEKISVLDAGNKKKGKGK